MTKKISISILAATLLIVGVYLLLKDDNNSFNSNNKNTNSPPQGNLILNTDKNIYAPGETVYIQITSLDDNGNSLCNSNLELTVNDQLLNVSKSSSCGIESLNPDYTAFYETSDGGNYKLTLKNKDNSTSIESQFQVDQKSPKYSITRWGPTKIEKDSQNRYPMKLIFKSDSDFSGQVVEFVPLDLNIIWYGPAKVDKVDDGQTISWDISLRSGEEKELTYEYTVSSNGKDTFELGPATVLIEGKTVFDEGKIWNLVAN